jgi:hypothetical protein
MSTKKTIEWLWHRTEQYRTTMNEMCEAIVDFYEVDKLGQGFSSANPLEEIDIGDGITPRPTFVNKNISLEHKDAIIKLLRDYVDCFTWNYREMPGLSRELVEYRLPIKSSFRPYKQPARRFNPIIYEWVEEVERLLDAGFIRHCRYAEWVFIIVPVEKKNIGKIWQRAFDDIKKYLSSLPVMNAPMIGIPFRLYITVEVVVIGAVLTQIMEDKEHIITYLSRRLTDAETRYSFIKKLCLSLFYACSKL